MMDTTRTRLRARESPMVASKLLVKSLNCLSVNFLAAWIYPDVSCGYRRQQRAVLRENEAEVS